VKYIFSVWVISLTILLTGCKAKTIPATIPPSPANGAIGTPSQMATIVPPTDTDLAAPSLTPTATLAETAQPDEKSVRSLTQTPTFPPEAHLQFQCLDLAPAMPAGASLNGVVVLGKYIDDPRSRRVTYLLDISTGNDVQISKPGEHQIHHAVSLDRKYLAYRSIYANDENQIIKDELVIATSDGQRLMVIPWERGWAGIPGWLNDQRLVINIPGVGLQEDIQEKAATHLVHLG
jgi:hypothetical protein